MSKYASRKYSMSIEAQATKKHPYGKGAAEESAEELVRKGRRYDEGQPYKEVAAQLQEQANFRHSSGAAGRKFEAAAKLARRKARAAGEYKTERRLASA